MGGVRPRIIKGKVGGALLGAAKVSRAEQGARRCQLGDEPETVVVFGSSRPKFRRLRPSTSAEDLARSADRPRTEQDGPEGPGGPRSGFHQIVSA